MPKLCFSLTVRSVILCYEPVPLVVEAASLSVLQVEKVKNLATAQNFARTRRLRQSLSRWKHGHIALLLENSNKMLLAVQFMAGQTSGEMMFYIQQGRGKMRGAHEARRGKMATQHAGHCLADLHGFIELMQNHHCA